MKGDAYKRRDFYRTGRGVDSGLASMKGDAYKRRDRSDLHRLPVTDQASMKGDAYKRRDPAMTALPSRGTFSPR